MKIIDLDNGILSEKETAVALGNFDGVHLGHQKLIKKMVDESIKKGLKPSILLFKEHTKSTIEDIKPNMLTSNKQKFKIFKDLGVEYVFAISFTEDLMKLKENEFIEEILVKKMNTKQAVVGFDYRFGYKARGNSDSLREIGEKYNIKTNVMDAIYIEDNPVSSTMIRDLIKNNELESAKKYLGRYFSIIGTVISGKKRGRKLGFPTANLRVDESYVLPKGGVYYTKTIYKGKEYKSVTNIGTNPTFEGKELKIETHIINFDEDIYDEELEVVFIDYIRADIKFSNIDELIKQVNEDINKVKNY